MRKIVAAVFVSLDGVMQAPGGPEEDPMGGFELGGWTFHYFDEAMGRRLDETFSAPFELLLGRRTYEIFAAHWPYAPADDPIGKVFNATRKYVVTSSREPLTWQNSTAIRGDVVAEIRRLKEQDGPMLLLQGSSELIQTLLSNGLIDEFRLMIFPLVLGRGKRLFGDGDGADGAAAGGCRHVDHRRRDAYLRAGRGGSHRVVRRAGAERSGDRAAKAHRGGGLTRPHPESAPVLFRRRARGRARWIAARSTPPARRASGSAPTSARAPLRRTLEGARGPGAGR
ncbi:MAG TPA: dihydrofolate reductase family protein [Burkholderiales bacterium]